MSDRSPPVRGGVVLVINALHSGGAEKCCIQIARGLNPRYPLEVVALLGGGPAEAELRAAGIRVTVLEATGPLSQIKAAVRLAACFRRARPDVVVTFLYLSDLVAGTLARLLVPRVKVFWNIHNNVLARRQVGFLTYFASRFNALLSRWVPNEIVYCAEASRQQHQAIGYRPRSSAVIENSADTVPFSFSAASRAAFRARRFEQDFLFLFVGRFDPLKRVDLFVEACALARARFQGRMRFVLAGRGMDSSNEWLTRAIAATNCPECFELQGFVTDQQSIYSGADCLVVTSESEGSPLAVYEAIATHLPVLILGTIGTEKIQAPGVRRLPTRNVAELAEAMGDVLLAGPAPDAARAVGVAAAGGRVEHPLVAYYRHVASCD